MKRGLFGLKKWEKETYEEKVETINFPLEANLIIKRLEETQFKSDSPTNFEEWIRKNTGQWD